MIDVYVSVELFQGIIADVRVFQTEAAADLVDQKWLTENRIRDNIDSECKTQNGTEFHIYTCTLEE